MEPKHRVKIKESIANLPIPEALAYLCQTFPEKVAFSTSFGQEDQVISHYIFSRQLPVRVFTLDTGRLFEETYNVFSRTLARYQSKIEVYYPENRAVEALLQEQGPMGMYDSVERRKTCCRIRKIEPLKRALANTEVWITGLRAGQSENRQQLALFDFDESFGVLKYNPLLDWTLDDVQAFLQENNIPQNQLHEQGFVSIGCAPCTRAIQPGEDIRAGRWWWEQSHKECGLHGQK
ncbi:MAG: phosphoadenylyl-sulfate reductase [Saprospiraceae bacterium]|nr:phosphoadenylyl-sulfate reductase [Saprospiraceae bacterium]